MRAPSPGIEAIDALLPQWQCGQCGHGSCRAYAEALAVGEASNLCPPGGDRTARALASLLGRAYQPLPADQPAIPLARQAIIEEPACIGCTLCIQACPVAAIAGAPQQRHTVIAEFCTGCGLCLPVCPVDCMLLLARKMPAFSEAELAARQKSEADAARARYQMQQRRQGRGQRRPTGKPGLGGASAGGALGSGKSMARDALADADAFRRQALIAAAIARARAKAAEPTEPVPKPPAAT